MKKGNPGIYNKMDGPWGHYDKWNQRKTNTVWFHLYMEPKKLIKNREKIGRY